MAMSHPTGRERRWKRDRSERRDNPRQGFFVVFRLYGAKQAFYDQTWRLPDIEKVK